jgi:hypothetical protein
LLFHRWPSVYPHPRLPTRNVEEPLCVLLRLNYLQNLG